MSRYHFPMLIALSDCADHGCKMELDGFLACTEACVESKAQSRSHMAVRTRDLDPPLQPARWYHFSDIVLISQAAEIPVDGDGFLAAETWLQLLFPEVNGPAERFPDIL
jgi:hypothetical protein